MLDRYTTEPTWMINTDVQNGTQWLCQPVRLVLPCFLPDGIRQFGAAWQLTGPTQSLLHAAVRHGCELTVAHLRGIHDAVKYPLPARGAGSGKRGALLREDYARALISFLFDSDPTVTQEQKDEMLKGMLGGWRKKQTVRCPQHVIAAVKELGKEAELDFQHVHSVALNQQAVEDDRAKRQKKAAAAKEAFESDEPSGVRTYTPTELKHLLPPGAWCNRQPVIKRYQGGFMESHKGGPICGRASGCSVLMLLVRRRLTKSF